MDPLRRVRAKLDGAKTQSESLSDEISRSVARIDKPYRLVPELDLDAGECLLRIEKVEEFPPPEWETAVGDIVHKLRSALDQLAYQLATLNQADEAALRGCEFPIFRDRDLFYSGGKGGGVYKIRALADIDREVIESLQPFDFPEHALWVLQQLSNGDKHRLGIVSADSVGLPIMQGPHFHGLRARLVRAKKLGGYEDGKVVATYAVEKTAPNPKVEVHFRPTIAVTIDEGIGRPPSHIGQVIPKLLSAVEKIVATFAIRF